MMTVELLSLGIFKTLIKFHPIFKMNLLLLISLIKEILINKSQFQAAILDIKIATYPLNINSLSITSKSSWAIYKTNSNNN